MRSLNNLVLRISKRRAIWDLLLTLSICLACWGFTTSPAPTKGTAASPTPIDPGYIPPNCHYTGNKYQVQRVKQTKQDISFDAQVFSPDKTYVVYQQPQGLFIRKTSTGESVQLPGSGFPAYDLPRWLHWSARGNVLAVIQPAVLYQQKLDVWVFTFERGLSNPTTVHVPTQLDHPYDFSGLSPDGKYLLVANGIVQLWSVASQSITYDGKHKLSYNTPSGPVWSPQGSYITYWQVEEVKRSIATSYKQSLTIAAANGKTERTFTVFDGNEIWPQGSAPSQLPVRLMWLADESYVALVHPKGVADKDLQVLDLYGVDGTTHMQLTDKLYWTRSGQFPSPIFPLPALRWASTGQALYFWERLAADQFRLMQWQPNSQTSRPVLHTTRPPFYPLTMPVISLASVKHVAILSQYDSRFRIDVMEYDGLNAIRLIDQAVDAGDPSWSPDGSKVAAVWATEKGEQRKVKLSWMDVGGGNFHTLDSDYLNISNVYWSADSKRLTFIGVDKDGFSENMLDTETGKFRRLADNLTTILYPRYNDDGTYFTYRWQQSSDDAGYDGYTADGQRLYRLRIKGNAARGSEIFWTPDRKHAAIKVRTAEGENLQIMAAAGSAPRIVRSGLSGLGDPLWSPDGTLVAFTQSVNRGSVSLVILDRTGKELWTVPRFLMYGDPIRWVACPTNS